MEGSNCIYIYRSWSQLQPEINTDQYIFSQILAEKLQFKPVSYFILKKV